jgi:hypothetical protein
VNKLIFLDIDGVLNDRTIDPASGSCTLLPRCVASFNRLLGATDAKVVISSAWRYMVLKGAMTQRGFAHMLRTHGVSREIEERLAGCTCSDEEAPTRGGQIAHYLGGRADLCRRFQTHPAAFSLVVLDDCPAGMDFAPFADRVVRTDPAVGLTDALAARAAVMLMAGPGWSVT